MIYGGPTNANAAEVRSAVGAQSVLPRDVRDAPSLRAAVSVARTVDCSWVWLLDGLAVPKPDALAALLAAHETATRPAPVLLASKVVDATGRLHPAATPRHEIFEKQHSVDAAERRLVQLRAAAAGSLLVDRAVFDRFEAPSCHLPPGLDVHEWSARILRSWEDIGYLVPASVAIRHEAAPSSEPRYRLSRLRMLASPAWRPRERLWEAFLLGRGGLGSLVGQGRDGVGAPGLRPSHSPCRTVRTAGVASRFTRR